jgi:rSAM/selenodomain-associated transferase 2
MISVVIPTLNAARSLPDALAPLVKGVIADLVKEVIIADGGSTDDTLAVADAVGCEVVSGAIGRGPQLIAGAAVAKGRWLLFLHADTVLADGWVDEAQRHIRASEDRAAAFSFAFDDDGLAARHAAFWVDIRCAVLRLPYGDQGLLISRKLYDALGGFKPMPLMEDVDLIRRIGRTRLALLRAKAVTSAEKYRRDGYARRSLNNLVLLARYLAGADPTRLAEAYAKPS